MQFLNALIFRTIKTGGKDNEVSCIYSVNKINAIFAIQNTLPASETGADLTNYIYAT
jgi:hypothetical protein